MSSDEPYPNGTSALRAIKAKAVLAQRPGAGSSVASLTRLAIFDRFLCRVFLMPNCPFVLKGGTAMLARLPDARGTTDVDFEAGAMGLQESISLISTAVTLDLADHFVFRYVSHRDTGGDDHP